MKKFKESPESFVQSIPQEARELSRRGEAKIYEYQAMHEGLSEFSEDGKKAVEKYFAGQVLTPTEHSVLDSERKVWWKNRFGFPYNNKIARFEALRREYAADEELDKAKNLQIALFGAVRAKDKDRVDELKKNYEAKYPDELEGVAALFGFLDFVKDQDQYQKIEFGSRDKPEKWGVNTKERARLKENLTQYQFLLTHFVEYNSADRKFLKVFWDVMERVAESGGRRFDFSLLRSGILGQVTAIKILKALGKNPRLSNPAEDAFTAVDLWAEEHGEKTALQIKRGQVAPKLIQVDRVSAVGVEVVQGQEKQSFSSWDFNKLQDFRMRLDKYRELTGQQVRGYLMIVSNRNVDKITGEPSEKIIDFFRKKLEEIEQKKE